MSPAGIIIFIAFAVLILFATHYFLYFSITRFFPQVPKKIAGVTFGFMGASFLASHFIQSWHENVLTNIYSLLSGFWLGLLPHFVVGFIAAWAIVGILRLRYRQIRMSIIGIFSLSLITCFSAYGVWNAMNPRIKNINVTIPNLPEEWEGKKIVQLSDVHLGLVNDEDFLRHIVEKVNSVNPAMVVITGDLLDSSDGDMHQLVKPLDDLRADKGIYFVTGNHETYLGLDSVLATLQKTKVTVLQDEVVDADGIKVVGISYPDRNENKYLMRTLEELKGQYIGWPTILLYHSPEDIDLVKNSGINLELCGHTHRGQIFPLAIATRIIFKGYDYGLFPMDDYTLYTTSGTGSWALPMRTGNTPEIVVITLKRP